MLVEVKTHKQSIKKVKNYDLESEEFVLGSMLLDTRKFLIVKIHPICYQCFYSKPLARYFNAIFELYDEMKDIDCITLVEKLKENEEFQDGDETYIFEITQKVPVNVDIAPRCSIIQAYYHLRMNIEILEEE